MGKNYSVLKVADDKNIYVSLGINKMMAECLRYAGGGVEDPYHKHCPAVDPVVIPEVTGNDLKWIAPTDQMGSACNHARKGVIPKFAEAA